MTINIYFKKKFITCLILLLTTILTTNIIGCKKQSKIENKVNVKPDYSTPRRTFNTFFNSIKSEDKRTAYISWNTKTNEEIDKIIKNAPKRVQTIPGGSKVLGPKKRAEYLKLIKKALVGSNELAKNIIANLLKHKDSIQSYSFDGKTDYMISKGDAAVSTNRKRANSAYQEIVIVFYKNNKIEKKFKKDMKHDYYDIKIKKNLILISESFSFIKTKDGWKIDSYFGPNLY